MTVLDPEKHARLIEDQDHICEKAGIPKSFIHKSCKEDLNPVELDWLVHYHRNRLEGNNLLLTGVSDVPVEVKMMGMTASMLRNFIDARVIPLNTLFQMVEEGNSPECTVLFIPNLYLRMYGKALPAWKVQQVYDFILARFVAGKATVVYVEDPKALEQEFGPLFYNHLMNHFTVSVGK